MFEQLSAIASKGVEPISEVFKETAIKSIKESPLQDSMQIIENSSLESLKAQNATQLTEIDNNIKQNETKGIDNNESKGLTEEEKQQIKNETGWSDEIIDACGSMKECEVYKNAVLQEVEINGKKCLVRSDIDWDQKDSMGHTNKERAEAGKCSINKDGETIDLHHIGQKSDGSLVELTRDEHIGKENNSVLHDTQKKSEIDRSAFVSERSNHWKERVNTGAQNA